MSARFTTNTIEPTEGCMDLQRDTWSIGEDSLILHESEFLLKCWEHVQNITSGEKFLKMANQDCPDEQGNHVHTAAMQALYLIGVDAFTTAVRVVNCTVPAS